VTNIANDLQHDEFGLFGSKSVQCRFVAQAVLLIGLRCEVVHCAGECSNHLTAGIAGRRE
jgi:hypothetical protein